MSEKRTEQTICGIRLALFAEQPTPEELAAIVARMDSEGQAEFLIALGEQLHTICSLGTYGVQLAFIRQALASMEKRDGHGFGSELLRELSPEP